MTTASTTTATTTNKGRTGRTQRGKIKLYSRIYERAGEGIVDRAAGVIRGVKVLGKHSLNGRVYSDKALEDAARLYEGAPVRINHPSRRDPGEDRGVEDQFGELRNARKIREAVYADLHYVKSHPMAEQICELAERFPNKVGLSHHCDGDVQHRDGQWVVESIARVESVDLVVNPATNRGLFEGENADDASPLAVVNAPPSLLELPEIVAEIHRRDEPTAKKLKRFSLLIDALELLGKIASGPIEAEESVEDDDGEYGRAKRAMADDEPFGDSMESRRDRAAQLAEGVKRFDELKPRAPRPLMSPGILLEDVRLPPKYPKDKKDFISQLRS